MTNHAPENQITHSLRDAFRQIKAACSEENLSLIELNATLKTYENYVSKMRIHIQAKPKDPNEA